MAIPTPEPGLVVSYAYLWNREASVARVWTALQMQGVRLEKTELVR